VCVAANKERERVHSERCVAQGRKSARAPVGVICATC
jgi:hypothetical protein